MSDWFEAGRSHGYRLYKLYMTIWVNNHDWFSRFKAVVDPLSSFFLILFLGSRLWTWSVLERWAEFFVVGLCKIVPGSFQILLHRSRRKLGVFRCVSDVGFATSRPVRYDGPLADPNYKVRLSSWKMQWKLWKFIQNFWVETPPLATLTLLYLFCQDVPNWGIQWGSRGCLPTRWRHVRGRTGAVEHAFCARRWERKTCLGGDPEKWNHHDFIRPQCDSKSHMIELLIPYLFFKVILLPSAFLISLELLFRLLLISILASSKSEAILTNWHLFTNLDVFILPYLLQHCCSSLLKVEPYSTGSCSIHFQTIFNCSRISYYPISYTPCRPFNHKSYIFLSKKWMRRLVLDVLLSLWR